MPKDLKESPGTNLTMRCKFKQKIKPFLYLVNHSMMKTNAHF
jgi:hypothetical protein